MEIPCPTWPLFIQDKLKISIYLSLGMQVQMYQAKLYNSIFHIMINYYELTSCIENSGDPDQLASSGAS